MKQRCLYYRVSYHHVFSFLGFLYFVFDLIKAIIFIRLPQPVEKIIKSSNTGRILNVETAEDCIQRGDTKKFAPFSNGRNL